MATHSSILAWEVPWMEEPGRATVHGVAKSRTRLSDFTFLSRFLGLPLIAQLVKNLPAMQETLVRFLGSGRSAGEGISYPLQYSSDSLVAQLVKNLPTMQETLVGFLGWEDPLVPGSSPG